MSERADKELVRKYREHNVTRARGKQPDGSRAPEPMRSRGGVVGETPNPHALRCQCDDCREVTRRFGRTVAREEGER